MSSKALSNKNSVQTLVKRWLEIYRSLS